MALRKQHINEQGIITDYHKVGSVTLRDGTLTFLLDSYVSKDYRNAEQCADSSVFRFDITVEEEESMGIRALCYSKIKELEDWSDAVDC